MLAFLHPLSEGLEDYSIARTRRGLRALEVAGWRQG